MFDKFQYRMLKLIAPEEPKTLDGSAYRSKSKLLTLFGDGFFEQVKDKIVIDFGCGAGEEAIELAQNGAKFVIGLDTQGDLLNHARLQARDSGVEDRCLFCSYSSQCADIIISLDSFEHFSDPAAILGQMLKMLNPGGYLLASFGPTWYHPLGGHLFSVFPWAHLIFSEKALLRWRSDIRSDGARCFEEVAGGLNKITVGRFVETAKTSGFTIDYIRPIPIRRLAILHSRWTREFTTAIVQCKLTKASP